MVVADQGAGGVAVRPPITPKELAPMLRRSAAWVRKECKSKRIPTCPPHRPPYMIPANVLFKLYTA